MLRFRDGAGRVIEKNILHESTLVGSSRGCDLRLKSDMIAPIQCLLSLDRWRLRIRDLTGAGGTTLNGQVIEQATLSDGDELCLGTHRFEVRTNLSGSEFHGFHLDHYQVTEVLGSGGMCWIYGARNALTHEHVALKVLPSNYSPRTLAHFSLEARVGQRLGEHSHVVRMSRIVWAEPVYCIVMEYLEGISLQELVERDGPLPWRQACHYIRETALALAHVHAGKVIHRDLKPNNLIVCRNGRFKLIDFNLALLLEDDQPDRLLQHYRRQVVGTADYISPEQSRRSDQIDARSDLYSLGCVFYFLLTGSVVFPIPEVSQKLQAQRSQPPEDVRQRAPGVPVEIAELVQRLLAKDPAQRIQTAQELAQLLEPFAQAEPVRFDWGAVLTARAATARRRLEKLLAQQAARRQESSRDSSVAVTDSLTDTPGGHGSVRSTSPERRPVEFDLFAALEQGTPCRRAEQQALSELFHLWPQLSPEAQQHLVDEARRLESCRSSENPPAAIPLQAAVSVDG